VTGVAPTTVKTDLFGLGYIEQSTVAGFAGLDVTGIESRNDRCEVRHTGLQIRKGTIGILEPNAGPRTQADTGAFHAA
jgi:hypothetical protein